MLAWLQSQKILPLQRQIHTSTKKRKIKFSCASDATKQNKKYRKHFSSAITKKHQFSSHFKVDKKYKVQYLSTLTEYFHSTQQKVCYQKISRIFFSEAWQYCLFQKNRIDKNSIYDVIIQYFFVEYYSCFQSVKTYLQYNITLYLFTNQNLWKSKYFLVL